MITWNNLDTLASFQELSKVERVNLVEAMSGENGANRVKNYSVPMAGGFSYNYAAKQVDDKVLAALVKLAEEAQLAEVILHEVQVMTLTGVGSRRMENVGTGMEVIGVYSPICHEMQMPFSMVLAQKLSTEKKVLYVNLMEHSGMLELLGVPGECDLGEVILALRRQRLTAETLGRGIHETEWMHYVEPFDNPEDLGEMTAGDLQELISFLEKQTSYEILLLDFGQGLRDFLSFLGLCTSIYCPMKSGFYYDCRMD